MIDASDIIVNNGKRDMTLDELARSQPGMDRLMAEIAERTRRLYFAVQAENWPLAGYFCRTLGKHLAASAFSRPKYADAMDLFLAEDYQPIREAISAKDRAAFDRAWGPLVARINHWHDEFGVGYLVYKTPDSPPPDLDLTPH